MLNEIRKLLSKKRIVYIADPAKVEYKFLGNYLEVWNEKIPYKELLGVIFLQQPTRKPRTKKVPVILPQLEMLNIKTEPYKESKRYIYFNSICHYVGRYLQSYLKRYLGKRSRLGVVRRVYSFFGYKKTVKENLVFTPIYTDCDAIKDEKLLFQRLSFYMGEAYRGDKGFYGILTLYTGILLAYHLGKKIP